MGYATFFRLAFASAVFNLLSVSLEPAGAHDAAPAVTTNRGHTLQRHFAGVRVGMEGTQLSCLDAEGLQFSLPPIERSFVAKVEEEDDRQAYAFEVACETARAMGACLDQVFVPRRQRTEIAHFLLRKAEVTLFGKAVRPPEAAESWPEPLWTRFAAARGFAPRVVDTGSLTHVLLSEFLPVAPLSRVQSFLPQHRRRLLARLQEIHASEPPRAPVGPAAPIGAAWARWQDCSERALVSPLSLDDLHTRLVFIDDQMRDMRIEHRVCHGDPAVGNTLMTKHSIFYIDWEAAGWDDPYRDVARVVSNSQWPHEALPHIMADYLGRSATPQEIRHLALLVAAFDIDHYGAARAATGEHSPYTARFARRVHRVSALLPDLPPVGMVSREGESP